MELTALVDTPEFLLRLLFPSLSSSSSLITQRCGHILHFDDALKQQLIYEFNWDPYG